MSTISNELGPELHAPVTVPTAVEYLRFEVRLYSTWIAGAFLNDVLDPVIYIARVPMSTLHKVVGMTGASAFVIAVFLLAALATLPHLWTLVVRPQSLGSTWPRRWACAAASAVSLVWFYLAVIAHPLDAGPLALLYGRECVGSLALAFLYAVSLNAQQLRQIANRILR